MTPAAAECPNCNDYEIRAGELIKYNGTATDAVIPDGVKRIGREAFMDCKHLTSVTIPDSVTNIEYNAFWGCAGLINITVPNSVTDIGSCAFSHCTGLTSATIPDSVTWIYPFAFSGCENLTDIKISKANWESFDDRFEGTPYLQTYRKTHGLCLNCGGKIGFFSGKCKRCGKKS